MKIAVFGASGMVGSRVAAEAVSRGHEVTGVTRSGGELPAGVRAVQGSANDLTTAQQLAADADVLVAAIGPCRTGGDHQDFLDAVDNLVAAVRGTQTRLFVVGGAGSLVVNGNRVVDGPDFPAEYKPESLTMLAVLEDLQATDGLDWFYVRPPALFGAFNPGEARGTYRVGGDVLLTDENGVSDISGADFAVAVVDEIETPTHRGTPFTVAH